MLRRWGKWAGDIVGKVEEIGGKWGKVGEGWGSLGKVGEGEGR